MRQRIKQTTNKSNVDAAPKKITVHDYKNLFYIGLTVRIVSVFLTKTFFVPDEYWQSTEVAHRKAFDYGYLTWEWNKKIRSYFYPFMFEVYFRLLNMLSLDFVTLIRVGPHFIQAVMTVFYDLAVYKYTYKSTLCQETALYAFFLNLCSWFIFYTGSRTLNNVAEMCFSTYGLSYFPLCFEHKNTNDTNSFVLALLFGGIACIVRPTCFLIWIPLVIHAILTKIVNISTLVKACCLAIPILLVLLFGIDFYFYGSLTFVHYNFLNFNVFQNIGEFYGVHSWHWYFTQGLPVVFNFYLMFLINGISSKSSHLLISLFYIFVHR